MFDASNFMSAVFEEANDTKRIPCPVGEHSAIIEKVEPQTGTISKGERMGQPWAAIKVTYNITEPAILQLLSRDKVVVTDFVMLDLTAQGGLDMGPGKNVDLGRLREACDLNQKGQPFSPMMLNGRMVKVSVSHKVSDRNPGEFRAEVAGVVRG